MRDLQRLVLDRLSELDLSYREAARRSRGAVSHATLGNIGSGRHTGRLADTTMQGLALALDVPLSTVEEAAGQTIKHAGTTFRLPDRANQLTPRQRRVVLSLVDTFLNESHG